MDARSQQKEKHGSERIVFRPDSAYTRPSSLEVLVFLLIAFLFLMGFIMGAKAESMDSFYKGLMFLGIITTVVCIFLAVIHPFRKRSYFDLVNGVLYPKGKNNAQIRYFYKDFDHLEIQNVLGGYALYLILKGGSNINILTNVLLESVQQDAMQLAIRLSLPMQDKSVKIPQSQDFDITADKVTIRMTSDDD